MQERKKLTDALKKAKNYIYEINETLYCISGTMFCKCTEKEIKYYRDFKKTLDTVIKKVPLKYVRDKSSIQYIEQLAEQYSKITKLEKEWKWTSDQINDVHCQIDELIYALSDDEYADIVAQYEKRATALQYLNNYITPNC